MTETFSRILDFLEHPALIGLGTVLAALGLGASGVWFVVRSIRRSRASDLTRDELRLLKEFNKNAGGNPRAYLDPVVTAQQAGLDIDSCTSEIQRLKDLDYLENTNIKAGVLSKQLPVWITTRGMRRAEQKR